MENNFRAALIDWLIAAPDLSELNAIEEESPLRASPPWLGISASVATDWSTKTCIGKEVRIALELVTRSDEAGAEATLAQAIEERVIAMPAAQPNFYLANAHFLRSRAERRGNNLRAALIEFRFRLLATPTE